MNYPGHWTGWMAWGVAFGPLLASALVNRTALALFFAWFLAEFSGEKLPIGLYAILDPIALAVIVGYVPFGGSLRQFVLNIVEKIGRSHWPNQWVIAVYPAMALTYMLPFTDRELWFVLFWLAMSQFIVSIAWPWPAFLKNRTETGRRGGISKPILTRDNL